MEKGKKIQLFTVLQNSKLQPFFYPQCIWDRHARKQMDNRQNFKVKVQTSSCQYRFWKYDTFKKKCIFKTLFYQGFVHTMSEFNIFLFWNKETFSEFTAAFLIDRSSLSGVFLGKGVLKICSKFTGEHSYRSAISIKLLCYKTTIRHGCSPLNLLHFFRKPFPKNTSR